MLFVVDASGSMAARQRMSAVKGAVLSLLLDAYQRRDKVGMVTFRRAAAEVALPPTSSVDAAAARLESLPTGGRTPLADGAAAGAREVLRVERHAGPARRPLLVVVTDGRATGAAASRVVRRPSRRGGRRGCWPRTARRRWSWTARRGRCGSGSAGELARELARHRRRRWRSCARTRSPISYGTPRDAPARTARRTHQPTHDTEGRVVPKGQPSVVPEDGLTTRQRRNRPLVAVHTGPGKGKSTAAFGLALRAWNQGWPIGVFQFVKSAKWKVGEERALRVLGASGEGGTVAWHKMGEGWSWIQRDDASWATRRPPARAGSRSSATWRRETLPAVRAGRVRVPDALGLGGHGRGGRGAARPAGHPARGRSPAATRREQLIDAADLVTEMSKVKHPMDAGQKGQRGIEW